MAMTPFSFDRVVLFGDSLTSAISADMQTYFLHQHALTTTVVNSSVGGRTSAGGAAEIDAAIAAIPSGEHAAFYVNLGTNNSATIMPPSQVVQRAQFIADMTYIYDAITTAGHTCLVSSIPFRVITGVYGGDSYDNPYLYGVDRLNVDLLIPLQLTKFPDQIGANGRPYIDTHNRFYNDFPTLGSTDGLHPARYIGLSRHVADTIMQLSLTGVAPAITRFSDPRTEIRKPATININLRNFSSPKCEVRGVNSFSQSGNGEVTDYENNPSGMYLVVPGASSGSVGVGSTTVGQDYLAPVQTLTGYFANAGETKTYTLIGAPKNVSATINIASSRNDSSSTPTEFFINGVSIGIVNSGSTSIVRTISHTFTTPSDGVITIAHTGTSFHFFNSAKIDFTYPAPPAGGSSSYDKLTLGLSIGL